MPRKRNEQKEQTENYTKAFPKVMRKLMKKTTQAELAEYLHKSRQAITYYCDGSSSPDWETLVKIADFFSVSTDYLLGRTEDPNRQPCAADELGLSQRNIEILQLAQKTVETYGCVTGLGSKEKVNPEVQKLSDIMEQSGYVNRYQFPLISTKSAGVIDYTQMFYDYAKCLIDFVDVIISSIASNGEIIDDYRRFCDYTPCRKIETNKERVDYIISYCFGAGGVQITEPEYARFKAGEIAKAIERFLIKEYVDGNH